MVLMALNANWIIDLVNQIPVGMVISCLPSFMIIKHNQMFLFFVGVCNETSNTTFICSCDPGWEGKHCQTKINYCANVICQNNGVCRPLFMNYTCECLGDSYTGRHCEITATKIKIYQIVGKSFAYVSIIALISVALFVVAMDVLKYCFGIDPVHEEREHIRRKKQPKRRKPVIQRFVYVNASPRLSQSQEQSLTEVETTV